ncbi:hypothetical protein [Streptomyces sp. Tu102]|uniref:hypothetical protein n=1 Tax=Streptomyces TaxID=1883 RepID=UPI001BDCA0D0|nr:hypothetical protein [Streptomyces sp. Tu102]MBT1093549.1 hypothetical protein [Streptomyces sp. Tu102]
MKATLTLGQKSASADLDPRLVGTLCRILRRKTLQETDVVGFLQQVSHFDRNKQDIINRHPGQVVVVGGERVAFAGTSDEAFGWASVNPQSGPVYIAATITSENAHATLLDVIDLIAFSSPCSDSDSHLRLQVGWEVPAGGSSQELDFLIDTGAARSCIDLDNASGMNLVAIVGVHGISAIPRQVLLLSGGQMVFPVEDSSTRATQTIKHSGAVLLASQRLIGHDVLSTQSLRLNMDFAASPPSVRLVR